MNIATDKSKFELNSNNLYNSNLNNPSFNSQSIIPNINQQGNLLTIDTKIKKDLFPMNIRYICPKCMIYPKINYNNENQLKYTCKCGNRQNLIISIDQLFDKKEEFLLFENPEINEKTKNQNKELICKCPGINKFKYYCPICELNLCEYCCHNHFHKGDKKNNELIVFDFYNKEIRDKIEEIKPIIINYKNIIRIENKFEDNASKDYEFTDEGGKDEIKKKLKKNLEKFYQLIEIIIFDYNNYPNFAHFDNIDNIYNF